MENKSKLIIRCVWCAVIVIAIFGEFYNLFLAGIGYGSIVALFGIAALGCSLVYALRGFGKDSALFFKLFVALFALSVSTNFIVLGGFLDPKFIRAMLAIYAPLYAVEIILAVAADQGKVRSLVLAGIAAALGLAGMIFLTIVQPGIVRGGDELGTHVIMMANATSTLGLGQVLMVLAKYADKDARGTT